MSSTAQSTSSGISLAGLLGVLFIGLKLGGVITWSWLWVLAPFWGGFALIAVIVVVWAIIVGLIKLIDSIIYTSDKKKQAKKNKDRK